jgi:hypothetical protein
MVASGSLDEVLPVLAADLAAAPMYQGTMLALARANPIARQRVRTRLEPCSRTTAPTTGCVQPPGSRTAVTTRTTAARRAAELVLLDDTTPD